MIAFVSQTSIPAARRPAFQRRHCPSLGEVGEEEGGREGGAWLIKESPEREKETGFDRHTSVQDKVNQTRLQMKNVLAKKQPRNKRPTNKVVSTADEDGFSQPKELSCLAWPGPFRCSRRVRTDERTCAPASLGWVVVGQAPFFCCVVIVAARVESWHCP